MVHHKIWLSDDNLDDLSITLNEDNLQAVCHDCHNRIHFGSKAVINGLEFDENGQIKEVGKG
ncbi:HNH endonuclease [Facklamia sp. P9177]|uniref:HNH endonuclease n=1 Tax=Facklamia sp. P9177 TaxID=3421945 RepID=UPI003D171D68